MKSITIYFFVFSIAFLFGCGGAKLMNDSLKINPGQSKDEVTKILGAPGNRQFNGKDEAWGIYLTQLLPSTGSLME